MEELRKHKISMLPTYRAFTPYMDICSCICYGHNIVLLLINIYFLCMYFVVCLSEIIYKHVDLYGLCFNMYYG